MIAVPLKEAMQIHSDALQPRGVDKPIIRERLDGWKEIAAYWRRSIRCVQRWEGTEGLPILRHQHAKGATVYAYRREIDQWWQERKTIVPTSARAKENEGRFSSEPNRRLRRIGLLPDTQEAIAFLLQDVLRLMERGRVSRRRRRG